MPASSIVCNSPLKVTCAAPKRLHNLHLLFGPPAAVAKILVQPDELDLVPADADAEPEAAPAQHVQRGRLLRDQHRLALRRISTPVEKPTCGAAGQEAEQHERIVEQIVEVLRLVPVRPLAAFAPSTWSGASKKS